MSCRVLLVEDHAMVATAFGAILGAESDIDLVATAATIEEAVALAAEHVPDLVVADQRLPDGEITDHIPHILEAAPGSAVLVVTGLPTEQAFVAAMDAGARGYVSKSQQMGEFLEAVRRVAAGATVIAPDLVPTLVRRSGARRDDRSSLTPRELQILQQLALGRGTGAIAAELSLSANTVRNHVSHLTLKLGAHSRLEAVSIGTRLGLVAPPA